MGIRDLPTLQEVQAWRAGKPLPAVTPRVIDRVAQKSELAKKERVCRRAVKIRDHAKCRVPGCRKAAAHQHHLVYRSKGGKWVTGNIVSLCVLHHQLVHAKVITIRGDADARLTFDGHRGPR